MTNFKEEIERILTKAVEIDYQRGYKIDEKITPLVEEAATLKDKILDEIVEEFIFKLRNNGNKKLVNKVYALTYLQQIIQSKKGETANE